MVVSFRLKGKVKKENFRMKKVSFPLLTDSFRSWLIKYSDFDLQEKALNNRFENKIFYNIAEEKGILLFDC
ncbi:MAG: hypothetical protein Q8880_12145 [Bacteroidota bacterium]|nr:hypothetical protein [Bacteroidota bacterium]